LPMISQAHVTVEYEKLRCAGSMKGPGNLLCLVVEVWERETTFTSQRLHLLRAIFRTTISVVGINGYKANLLLLIRAGYGNHFVQHVLHLRAVIADEHDNGCLFGCYIVQRNQPVRDGIKQSEIWATVPNGSSEVENAIFVGLEVEKTAMLIQCN
jgi:hypothetical protein